MAIPETLKNKLANGQVIPFVGAGVSMSVMQKTDPSKRLFPSWKELLLKAAEKLTTESKEPNSQIVKGFLGISPPDYYSAAEHARKGLGSLWYDLLKEQIDRSENDADQASLEFPKSLWKLNSNLIITTNYDKVLRWTSPSPSDMGEWIIESKAEQAEALRIGVKRPTVWHLHGHIGNASEMILTLNGYKELYPDEGTSKSRYEASLQTLNHMIIAKSLLFIGFSMDDEYVAERLQYLEKIFKGATGPHYIITKKEDVEIIHSKNPNLEILEVSDYGQPILDLIAELSHHAVAKLKKGDTEVVSLGASPAKVADYGPHNRPYFLPYRPKKRQAIGIDDKLAEIREQLIHGQATPIGQTALLLGIGGLGKTQLAVEYSDRYGDEYKNGIIWIQAWQDIEAQLTEIAVHAKWVAPESEHKIKLDVAKHRLKNCSDCLIIFDNLESQNDIEPYLPEPGATPHILATSKHDLPNFTSVPIDFLPEKLALDLFLMESGRAGIVGVELNAAEKIVGQLGGLPLAIEIAGAYLKHRKTLSCKDFQFLLSKNIKEALQEKFLAGSFTKHYQGLFSTLKINEDSYYNEHPLLLDVVNLLASSGNAYMGRELVASLLDKEVDFQLSDALALGVELKILQKAPNANRYTLHNLVKEVHRDNFKIEVRTEWVEGILNRIERWFQKHRLEFTDLPLFEAEIDHLNEWLNVSRINAPSHLAKLTWLLAYPSYHRGNYKKTLSLLEKALKLYQDPAFGIKDDEFFANLLNDYGAIISVFGGYKKALELDEKALKIRLELFGERHRDTAMSYDHIGAEHSRLGDRIRALEYNEKALKIRFDLFVEKHPDTASSYSSIGVVYSTFGDHKMALGYDEKALEIRKKLFGEMHPDTAVSYNNVGANHSYLGDPEKALENYQKALGIRMEVLGEMHPGTAKSLDNIGIEYLNLGNPNTALGYIEKAFNITKDVLGEIHPDAVIMVEHVVNVRLAKGQTILARKILDDLLHKLPKENIKYEEIKKKRDSIKRHGFR